MAIIGKAKNIFEESRPLFFITGLVGLRPPRFCSIVFPGYLYVGILLVGYYALYVITLSDTLGLYDAMSAYTKITKTRVIEKLNNLFFVSIMIISSVISSSKIRQLYIDINAVDDKMRLLNVQFNYFVSMKREFFHVSQVILITIIFNLIEYFPQIGPDTPNMFDLMWIVNTLPEFINSLVITSFVIVISKIRRRFEAINRVIPNLMTVEKSIISTLESETNNLFRLRLLNRIHEKLVNAAMNVNEAYGPLILTSFVVYFLTSCAHLRTVTLTFGKMNNFIDFNVELFWAIFYLGKYVYVIDACHKVTVKGKLSGRHLYEKCMDADHQPLRNEADAMARRVLSRVLQLTACNFFVIDYPALKKIVVTLVAYVFFVSQFSANSTQIK